MPIRNFIFALVALPFFAQPILAANLKQPKQSALTEKSKQSIELFGTPLKEATRSQLRDTFKKGGLQTIRENDSYWTDIYDASNVLDGASELRVWYVMASGKFAGAEYTFPAFMDKELVKKVINMVATKYGPPTSQNGNYALGNVKATWNMGNGMKIEVSRGWPDTTTLLAFIDHSANAQTQQEIALEKKKQEQEKAKAQSHAF